MFQASREQRYAPNEDDDASFFASRRLNDATGFITGVLTLTPFVQWRRDHALHHASSGDLDRRGHGDVPTLTVREYLARPAGARLRYRILRHPAVLLLGGPLHLALVDSLSPVLPPRNLPLASDSSRRPVFAAIGEPHLHRTVRARGASPLPHD